MHDACDAMLWCMLSERSLYQDERVGSRASDFCFAVVILSYVPRRQPLDDFVDQMNGWPFLVLLLAASSYSLPAGGQSVSLKLDTNQVIRTPASKLFNRIFRFPSPRVEATPKG